MLFADLKPALISLSTSFGSTLCCVLPMTIVLLGLGSGGFMMLTMQYRVILYPLKKTSILCKNSARLPT
mgnify:CR=1 FL=1